MEIHFDGDPNKLQVGIQFFGTQVCYMTSICCFIPRRVPSGNMEEREGRVSLDSWAGYSAVWPLEGPWEYPDTEKLNIEKVM